MTDLTLVKRLRDYIETAGGGQPTLTEAADAIEQMAAALVFYADPFGKCDRVPDFYDELDFGETADAALRKVQP